MRLPIKGACIVPEVPATAHEVVLVTAETVALGITVVLQQVDPPGDAGGGQAGVGLLSQVSHDQLVSTVLGEQVLKTVALSAVFRS